MIIGRIFRAVQDSIQRAFAEMDVPFLACLRSSATKASVLFTISDGATWSIWASLKSARKVGLLMPLSSRLI